MRKIARLKSRPALLWFHYWSARANGNWEDTSEDSVNKILKVEVLHFKAQIWILFP